MAMDVDGLLSKDGQVIRSLGGTQNRGDAGQGGRTAKKGRGERARRMTTIRVVSGAHPAESLSLDDVLGTPGLGMPDATGGINSKMSEAMRMASSGTEVRLVSGLNPAEFSKALKGVGFHGTSVRVPPGVSSG